MKLLEIAKTQFQCAALWLTPGAFSYAEVHRIAMKHNLGGNKEESPGILEIPGLSLPLR